MTFLFNCADKEFDFQFEITMGLLRVQNLLMHSRVAGFPSLKNQSYFSKLRCNDWYSTFFDIKSEWKKEPRSGIKKNLHEYSLVFCCCSLEDRGIWGLVFYVRSEAGFEMLQCQKFPLEELAKRRKAFCLSKVFKINLHVFSRRRLNSRFPKS